MCDPMTIGSMAVGLAGTAANTIGQMNAQQKQEDEYAKWVDYQKRIQQQETQRQEEMRGKAEVARQQGVEDVSAQNQAALQTEEAGRLGDLYSEQGAGATMAPAAAADAALAGQQGASGDLFQQDLARGIADAARSAKQRIGALATVNSFGGSFGGLGTVNPLNQARSGSEIDFANDLRRGSLAAFETEKAVPPKQIEYTPSPFADLAGALFSVGSQGLGGKLSSVFGGAVKPKIKPPAGTGGLLGHV